MQLIVSTTHAGPKEKDSRRITFCNIFSGLLDHFKVRRAWSGRQIQNSLALQSLVTPYMSFLFQPIIDILKEFDEDGNDDLWHAIIKVLTKSFVHDERGKSLSTSVAVISTKCYPT